MNFQSKQFIASYLKDKDKQDLKKSILKIQQDQSSITIQTQNIAVQAIFASSILKVLEYLEQYQKYNYRAALSGINLQVDQYDNYYAGTKEKVQHLYNNLTHKSMKIIQDLLISLKVARIQAWRQQAMAASILKTALYGKNLCPYNFNSKQFDPDLHQVLTITTQNKLKPAQITKIISQLSKKMKNIQSQKMQQMFSGKVISPYLSQNKYNNEVNPSKIYSSFMKQLSLKMLRVDQNIYFKFIDVHGELMKYTQSLYEHNMKMQKCSINLIKKYNEQYASIQTHKDYISPPIFLTVKNKFIAEEDCLHAGKQKWSELKLALVNKQHRLQYKGYDRVVDMQTGKEEIVQQKAEDLRGRYSNQQQYQPKLIYGYNAITPKHQPLQYFAQQRQIDSKQFYNLKQYIKQKYRQQQMNFHHRFKQRQKFQVNIKSRRQFKVYQYSSNWIEFFRFQYAFSQLHLQRIQRQIQLVQYNRIKQDNQKRYSSYSNQNTKEESTSHYRTNQQNKAYLLRKKMLQQQAIIQQIGRVQYQKLKRQQQKQKLTRYNYLYKKRTYENFMSMSKLQIQNNVGQDGFIHRYGLAIMKHLVNQTNMKDVDKLFYYYFKERYYRENQWIKENADNPIVFLDSGKVNMDASQKIVAQLINSIVKRIATVPFFIIWSQDILVYKLHESKQEKYGQITIYPLGNYLNMQKLVYEIRRRVKIPIKQVIHYYYHTSYCKIQSTQLQKIASKVEITHRSIYQRHLHGKSLKNSIQKGEQIINQIISEFQ